MPTTVREETVQAPGYGFGTIPDVIYNPIEVLRCPANFFSTKMEFLEMILLHYLMFLLEIVKDEEENADMVVCVCLTMSAWNHNLTTQ